MANANQSSSRSDGPQPTTARDSPHAYDDPRLGPRAFLLAVMHDPDVPIRDRMDAASKLLRIYGDESFRPSLTYRIAPFPSCHSLSTEAEPGPTDETTEINSHSLQSSQIPLTHLTEAQALQLLRGPLDHLTFEQITQIVAAIDPNHLPMCACGHRMPFPCKCVSVN